MKLVIATKSLVATEPASIKWVAKGGSSINSEDGRWALRKNTKGEWKVLDNGTMVNAGLTKDEAKAYAEKVVAAPSTDLTLALAAGDAQVYSVRSNGTMRRRHFLAVGSAERNVAEWVRAQRTGSDTAEARTMASIASEMHTSVSAVRRILVDLAITEQLAAMDQDELEAILVGGAEL